MKTIPLSQDQHAIVDDKWHEFLSQWKWHARWDKTTNSFYAMRTENGKKILMHRVIMNTPDNMVCDHVNHDTLDNREGEMRNVTKSQSVMNRRKQKNNKTGVAGITMRKNSAKFRATLAVNGKMVFDRSFHVFEDAVKARRTAEEKYFGEFSYAKSETS